MRCCAGAGVFAGDVDLLFWVNHETETPESRFGSVTIKNLMPALLTISSTATPAQV
ncbi:hypothetical protein SPHINGOT1_120041 [Sphingomonas sp. T1]|nr:hypothetical protein SPHINGOT1_120041 [Sphingomonas sp. T1]